MLSFKTHLFTLLLTLGALASSPSFAQSSGEKGNPFIIRYSFKDYGGDPQNWAILQGGQGKIYVGNTTGLLEYDGIAWRRFTLPNQSTVRSLALGESGKIYAGGQGELGYFQPDAAGKLSFHSLLHLLPASQRDFGDVWNTVVLKGQVYFNVASYVFIWNPQKNTFLSIPSQEGFHLMFPVNDKIYIREWGKGLCLIRGDSAVLVKGGEQFAQERIYVMLPFPGEKDQLLVGTRSMGLFKYNGQQFTPFKTQAEQFLKDNLIYLPGTLLQDDNFLLGTLGAGAVVMDRNGQVQQYFNKANGVTNNSINYSFQDRAGTIWLATDNGITSIDYNSPVVYFDERNQLNTIPNDLVRHQGKLYLAGNSGVYCLHPQNATFQALKNSSTAQYFSFATSGNTLLLGGNEGLFKIAGDALLPIRKSIANEYNVFALHPSRLQAGRVYVGTYGLWALRQEGTTWVDEGNIIPSDDSFNQIEELADGSLWVGTQSSGVYRVRFARGPQGDIRLAQLAVEQYGAEAGLQKGGAFPIVIKGAPYFNSTDSLYKFDEGRKRFYTDLKDPIVAAFYKLANKERVITLQVDSLNRLWLSTSSTLAMGSPGADGSYTWETKAFQRFAPENINKIYAEKTGQTWWLGFSNLIKYDFGKKAGASSYAALLSRVVTGGDSTLYFGGHTTQVLVPQIAFDHNSVLFSFAATSFEEKGQLQFQTFLEGFDKGWSAWSKEPQKEYTNLPPGGYTFRVKAINASGQQSSVASYSFEILPPWYRTWWAYALWALLLGIISYGFVRLQQNRAVVREKEKSAIREANLKADAENERRKNIELISEMGQDITASLSIENIIETVYTHVNKLMDASVFGIGIINRDKQQLDFPATKEKGQTLSPYSYRLDDASRPASWCYNNRKELFINDYEKEHPEYVSEVAAVVEGEDAASLIYLPLLYKAKAIGVITAQSFSKNAYNEYHLNVLRSLATYTAVALDNADAYRSLQATQAQLIQSEKLASLGELTAGIAHEIQNPLNFVNNFAEVSAEMLGEMKEEIKAGNTSEVIAIADDLEQNLSKINHHGQRASSIVKGMLEHSRVSTGVKEPTDLNALADEYLRLAYHGLRAKDNSFNATIETHFDPDLPLVSVIPQDIGRVLLNLINNAFYAVAERSRSTVHQRDVETLHATSVQHATSLQHPVYHPTVTVSTQKTGDQVIIKVQDNGNGIPESIREKIFQPFFTTKPTGQGTGLGLSLAYDIVVKGHGGTLEVESTEGVGSAFIFQLPIA